MGFLGLFELLGFWTFELLAFGFLFFWLLALGLVFGFWLFCPLKPKPLNFKPSDYQKPAKPPSLLYLRVRHEISTLKKYSKIEL